MNIYSYYTISLLPLKPLMSTYLLSYLSTFFGVIKMLHKKSNLDNGVIVEFLVNRKPALILNFSCW